jgi:ATP-binding cassette subfamily C protein
VSADLQQKKVPNLASSAHAFLREFASFAGRKGVLAAIFVGLGALFESVGLVLIIPLLGIVIGHNSIPGRLQNDVNYLFGLLGIHTPTGRLVLILCAFGVLMALRAIVISIRDVTLARLQIGFVESRRTRLINRLAAARWDQVVKLRHARITHLLSGDIQRISTAAQVLLQCTVAAVIFLLQCVLAVVMAPLLALLVISLLVAGFLALVPVLRRARALGNYVSGANLELLDSTAQFLGGLKLAMSQNLQASFVAEFQERLQDLTHRQIAFVRQGTNSRLAIATLSSFLGAIAVLVGFGVLHTPAPVLITLLLILVRLSAGAGQLQQGAQQLVQSLPAYEKVRELEEELAAAPGEGGLKDAPAEILQGPIAFENVSFRHTGADDSENASVSGVRDLTVSIADGEFIGITGPSGAGKSTFADLLVGLFPAQTGRILVAGALLDDMTLPAWRAQIGYVPQDPFLFHDTVRRNLSWANPRASEEEIWSALALAGADTLVGRLEQKLDTVVGERGTLVSGGERQRIALARAILRKPHLLVLDEATSAIDIASEREIIERLLDLTPHPTIVLIAHRAASLALCERVLQLAAGRLVAEVAQAEHVALPSALGRKLAAVVTSSVLPRF